VSIVSKCIFKDTIIYDEKCTFFNKDMEVIGAFGILSKAIRDLYKIKVNLYLGEFNISHEKMLKTYKLSTDHMCISRDISFYMKPELSYYDISSSILSLIYDNKLSIDSLL
jgi:phenylalanyl-tRNA synthetase beta subunit